MAPPFELHEYAHALHMQRWHPSFKACRFLFKPYPASLRYGPDQADVYGPSIASRTGPPSGGPARLPPALFEGLALAAQEAPDGVVRHVDLCSFQFRRQRTHLAVWLYLQSQTHGITAAPLGVYLTHSPIFGGIRPPDRSTCPIWTAVQPSIPNRSRAVRTDRPSLNAAAMRVRESRERGRTIITDLQSSNDLESQLKSKESHHDTKITLIDSTLEGISI